MRACAKIAFAEKYSRAFPVELGSAQCAGWRLGARALLNVDGGMYLPGSQMASSVATHATLLGAEGFRRFRVGAFIAALLDDDSRARVRQLYMTDRDPVSQALRPLFQEGSLVERSPRRRPRIERTPFELALGRTPGCTSQTPAQQASPVTACGTWHLPLGHSSNLRCGAKVWSTRNPSACGGARGGPRPLREKAVLSLRRCVSEFDHAVADLPSSEPLCGGVFGNLRKRPNRRSR